MTFEEYCQKHPGSCGTCKHQAWNRTAKKTYCDNPDSPEYKNFRMNDEGCDKCEERTKETRR